MLEGAEHGARSGVTDHSVTPGQHRVLIDEAARDRLRWKRPETGRIQVLPGGDHDLTDHAATGRSERDRAEQVTRLGVEDGSQRDEDCWAISAIVRPGGRWHVVGEHTSG